MKATLGLETNGAIAGILDMIGLTLGPKTQVSLNLSNFKEFNSQ